MTIGTWMRAAGMASLVAVGLALLGRGGADAEQPPRAGAPPGGYVGAETCLVCHEGYDTGIDGSRHAFARDPRTPAAAYGCESCHGPGEAHVQDPASARLVAFSRLRPEEVTASCLTCHARGESAFWHGSAHDARSLSCTSCHSVHQPKSARGLLRSGNQLQQCATCHRDKVNKLDRSGHMPVREGKMECSSCHNPHGSSNVRLLRAGHTINESCTTCHAEKRGPFLFEHPVVSGEGCTTCHDPHGSSNDRMLVAKLPFLCQRCHNFTRHPSTIYDNRIAATSNRVFSRSCVTCHTTIHGSNHPAGSRFVR